MKNRQEPELIEVLGEDGYLLLLEAFGGQVTYIPKGDGETVLSEAIGLGLATIMAEHYGGEHIDIPLSRPFRAKAYFAKGKTVKWISKKLLMSERHVYKVLAELSPLDRERRQPDLFEDSA